MVTDSINPVNPKIQIQTGSSKDFLSHKKRWCAKMLGA